MVSIEVKCVGRHWSVGCQNHRGCQSATGVLQNHWSVSKCRWSVSEPLVCVLMPLECTRTIVMCPKMLLECVRTTGVCQYVTGVRQSMGWVQMPLECVRINGWCPNAAGVCHSHSLSRTTGATTHAVSLPPSTFACVKTSLECVRCHPLECTWSVSDAIGVYQSYWISSDATVESRVLPESVRAMSDATGVSGASHWSMPDTITGVCQMPLECVRLHWSMSHSNGIH